MCRETIALPEQTTNALGDHRRQPHRHGVAELAHDLRPSALEQERVRERRDAGRLAQQYGVSNEDQILADLNALAGSSSLFRVHVGIVFEYRRSGQ